VASGEVGHGLGLALGSGVGFRSGLSLVLELGASAALVIFGICQNCQKYLIFGTFQILFLEFLAYP